MEIINFTNIKAQNNEKNKIEAYIELTHQFIRALDDMTAGSEQYLDLARDFKNRIKMLDSGELEKYISILFKKKSRRFEQGDKISI